MDVASLQSWIDGYERAWRSAGTEALADLFSADVRYWASPWDEPMRGVAELDTFWEAERDGPDETFEMASTIVAVDGPVGVVRVEVNYGDGTRWLDLWIVRFDEDGRCRHFEEWPIGPPTT